MADKRIQAALAALPNDFRVAVYYIDVQGYTYAETAAMLNIPHGTVMSRLARGRVRAGVADDEAQVRKRPGDAGQVVGSSVRDPAQPDHQ